MININIKKSAKENQPDVFKHGNSHRIESKRVKRLFIGTISLWTLIVIFLILSIFYYSNIGIQQNLLGEARAIYNMDLADRQWATMHGGIYVPVTDKTSPNPYLKNIGNRDVVTTNGTKLTLMNPEYILRELNENFKSGFGVYGHLTSLNPIRKENSPDNWERDALTKLSSNQNEYFEFVDIYGIKHIKYIKLLPKEKGCINCHLQLGLKGVNLNGGISITLSGDKYVSFAAKERLTRTIGLFFMWMFGIVGLSYNRRKIDSYKKLLECDKEDLKISNLELEEANKNLTESEERYRKLVEFSPDAIAVHIDRKLVFVNKSCLTLLKAQSKEQLIGMNIFDLIQPDCKEYVTNRIEEAFKKNEPAPLIEEKFLKFDGTSIDVEVLSVPIKYNSQLATQVIARDISDRKKARQSLIDSQQKYLQLVELMNEGLMQVDNDDVIQFANSKICRMFGYELDELIGTVGYKKIVDKDDWGLLIEKNLNRMSGISEAYEIRMRKKNGELMIVEINGSPIIDNNGETLGSIGVFTDITARKQVEDSLKASEEKFKSAFRTSPDALTIIDILDNKCMEVNPGFTEMTGYTYEESVNKSFKEVNIWKNNNDRAKLMEIIQDNRFLKNFEAEFLRKDGLSFTGLMSAGLFTMNNNTFMLSITRDITERKDYEKKLEAARLKAEENDILKSAFLANMSHEIRTPMNGIIGFAEMLRSDDKFSDDDKESLDIICKSGNQLLNIVNDILDISKIEAGQFKIIEKECNLKKIMNELYILLNSEIKTKKKGIELRYRITNSGFNSNVLADELRLRQILMNILNNAVKFTETGFIEYGCSLIEKDFLLFTIKDTGIGIPENNINVVFDRFRQIEFGYSRKFGGTGLGLSIAKGLVEIMGGEIWCESEVGKGSIFSFKLPYKPITLNIENPINSNSENQFNWGNKTFLIVEDDFTSFLFLKRALQKTKAKIIYAKNAAEAVEFFKNYININTVLLDISLPDISGFDIVKKLIEIRNDIPIIAQTANALSEVEKFCLDSGCKGYITKPINIYKLLMLINKFMV